MRVLTAPLRGLIWIFEEVADRAEKAIYGEEEELRNALSDLHAQWAANEITDEEFDDREEELILRMERLQS